MNPWLSPARTNRKPTCFGRWAARPGSRDGTSLYDAVISSVPRLERMSTGTRISRGSPTVTMSGRRQPSIGRSLPHNVPVSWSMRSLRGQGRLADARENGRSNRRQALRRSHISRLGAIYAALGRELDRTWQITYYPSTARRLAHLQAAGGNGDRRFTAPGSRERRHGRRTAAGFAHENGSDGCRPRDPGRSTARRRGHGRHPATRGTGSRPLRPHVKQRDETQAGQAQGGRLEALTVWTESALADLPGSDPLTRSVERSGLKVRLGHVPYLALISAFFLGIVGTILGAWPIAASS